MKATLITGASGGIGAEFARRLAARKQNLVLVARSEDKLAALANETGRAHGVTVVPLAFDLTTDDAPQKIFDEMARREFEINLLINNAGFGSLGEFTRFDAERDMRMIDLNIKSLVALTHLFIRPMQERKAGAIINVASTAAFQPVPFMAVYAATKAFVLSFSEALAEENRERGVKILALCPGATDTNFFDAAEGTRPPMRVVQTPEQVVTTALRALDRGQSHVISGWTNFLTTEIQRLVPRSLVTRVAGKAMRSTYIKNSDR